MKSVHVGQYNHKIEYRQLQRDGVCRCCWKDIKRNDEDVVCAAGGRDAVIICRDCISSIKALTGPENSQVTTTMRDCSFCSGIDLRRVLFRQVRTPAELTIDKKTKLPKKPAMFEAFIQCRHCGAEGPHYVDLDINDAEDSALAGWNCFTETEKF